MSTIFGFSTAGSKPDGKSYTNRFLNATIITLAFLALVPVINAAAIEPRVSVTAPQHIPNNCTVLSDGTLWLDCMQAIEYRQNIKSNGGKMPSAPKIKQNGSGKMVLGQTLDPRKPSSALPLKNSTELHHFLKSIKVNSTSDLKHQMPSNSSHVLKERAGFKVMVVGDSISHGHEGDYTWRYRLWQWFNTQGVAATFVGPYLGTIPPSTPAPPKAPAKYGTPSATPDLLDVDASGGYAAGQESFNSNHFAVWGRQCAQDKSLIKDFVSIYGPDVLLIELGFNDLGWFVSGPTDVLICMKTMVDSARTANPYIKIAIANVPYRTAIDGREDLPIITDEYNQLLATAIPSWSTELSPIALVKFRENYSCELAGCPAGHDGLHPNSMGEFQIAKAFSDTLVSSFGIGSSPLALPGSYPQRPTPTPSNFQCGSSVVGITCSWDAVYGAFSYDINYMNTILGTWIVGSTYGTNGWYQTWTLDGWEFQYQVRTNNGDAGVSAWTSGTISAISHPQVPFPPNDITSNPTATGVDFTWEPSTGDYNDVSEYATITWDQDIEGAYIDVWGCDLGGSTHVDKLIPGHHYIIAMTAYNENGGSYPAAANAVTVGDGTPGAPTEVRIQSIDGTTVTIDWCGDCAAAAYKTWFKNINDDADYVEDQSAASGESHGVGFLFPGVWNYEFCVSAVNGELESAKSECVVAPQPGKTAGGSGACDLSNCASAGSGTGTGGGSSSGGGSGGGSSTSPGWLTVSCTSGSLGDSENDPAQQWKDAQAGDAWAAALDNWNSGAHANFEFSNDISNFFTGPIELNCAHLGDTCWATLGCGSSLFPNAPVDCPAGYLILNSFMEIHKQYDTFYQGMINAQANMGTAIGAFSSTFAPAFDEQKALKITLDVLGFVFAMFAAPLWNDWLKGLQYFKSGSGNLGLVKDAVNAMVSQSITIVKDSSSATSALNTQNEIGAYLTELVSTWTDNMDASNKALFDGGDTTVISQLIDNGMSFNVQNLTSTLDAQRLMEAALFGYMIPVAWGYSSQKVIPFIATDANVLGNDAGTVTCDNWEPWDPTSFWAKNNNFDGFQEEDTVITQSAAENSFVCAPDGNAYWLVNMVDQYKSGCSHSGNTHSSNACLAPYVKELPGIAKLDGDAWGGVSKLDLAAGSIAAWQANGNQNGWTQLSLDNSDTLDSLFDNGIRAPGLINIPVCSFDEALTNVRQRTLDKGAINVKNWPCN